MSDPVAQRIVPRLDRPSGNITGFALDEATLGGKWLELLSEIAPGLKRVAIMFNPDTAPVSAFMPSLETAARTLKVEPIITPVHRDAEIEAPTRLPAVYPERLFVIEGGLACYGPDIIEQFRLAAAYVDRILKGERPADLPVQAPTKFDLAINLKAAKALSLTIPETLLATADVVIQ